MGLQGGLMEYGVMNSVWSTGRIKGVWSENSVWSTGRIKGVWIDELCMEYRED